VKGEGGKNPRKEHEHRAEKRVTFSASSSSHSEGGMMVARRVKKKKRKETLRRKGKTRISLERYVGLKGYRGGTWLRAPH